MFLFFRREHHPDLWIEIRRSGFAAETASLDASCPSPAVVYHLTHSARTRRRAPAKTCREVGSASPRFFDREKEKKGSTPVLPQ